MKTVFDVATVCLSICAFAYIMLITHLYYIEKSLEEDTNE